MSFIIILYYNILFDAYSGTSEKMDTLGALPALTKLDPPGVSANIIESQ